MLNDLRAFAARNSWSLFWVALILAGSALGLSWLAYDLYGQKIALDQKTTGLERTLAASQAELASTTAALSVQISINEDFAGQIGEIQGTVNVLDKLAKTDPELLQKYSKVYFLNENYAPPTLKEIDTKYLANKKRQEHIHAAVWPHLEQMLRAASSSKSNLLVVSAYRSFSEQAALKSNYLTTFGTGANKFSADQGYSEHQLGTTVDLSTGAQNGSLVTSFDQTTAYKWLNDHAYRYGFILSYPQSNRFYQYEPWHWRFVGEELATRLHEEGQYFYGLDQREIDKYLANIFD